MVLPGSEATGCWDTSNRPRTSGNVVGGLPWPNLNSSRSQPPIAGDGHPTQGRLLPHRTGPSSAVAVAAAARNYTENQRNRLRTPSQPNPNNVPDMEGPLDGSDVAFLFTSVVRKHLPVFLSKLAPIDQSRALSIFQSLTSAIPEAEHRNDAPANQARLSEFARKDPKNFGIARLYAAKFVRPDLLCYACEFIAANPSLVDAFSSVFASLETYMNFSSVPLSTARDSFMVAITDNSELSTAFRRKKFDPSAATAVLSQKAPPALLQRSSTLPAGSGTMSTARATYQWDSTTEEAVARNFDSMREAALARRKRHDNLSGAIAFQISSTSRDAFKQGIRRKADSRMEPDAFSSASTGRVLESSRIVQGKAKFEEDSVRQMPTVYFGSTARLTYRDPHGGYRDPEKYTPLLAEHDGSVIGPGALTNRPSKFFGETLSTNRADLRPPPAYFPAKGRPARPVVSTQPYSTLSEGFPDGCISTGRKDYRQFSTDELRMK